MFVTREDRDLSVKCGDIFKIEVESNPSTGYKWHLLFFDEDILKLLSNKFVPDMTNHIGSQGIEQFNFEAIKEGRTSIKIAYKRAWEKQTAKLNEFFVNVI